MQVWRSIAAGTARRTPQDHGQVTYAPMLSRELSPIDWSRSGQAIHNKIRGLVPWPATSTDILRSRSKSFHPSGPGDGQTAWYGAGRGEGRHRRGLR
ncbi:MAG: hypothetical protein V8S34_08045 [Lawsonibacter sp.]